MRVVTGAAPQPAAALSGADALRELLSMADDPKVAVCRTREHGKYVLQARSGEVIELPLHDASDDWPQYAENWDLRYHAPIRPPERGIETFRAEFEAAWEHGGLWIAVWHPFVSGRLSRAIEVGKLIEHMQQKGGVWFATLREIAAHVRACADDGSYSPRRVEMPYYSRPVTELDQVLGP